MVEKLTQRYHMRWVHLATLLVIVSFLVVPVRCDASAAPHSIFVPADAMAMAETHAHHAAAATQPTPEKSVPHHSPVAADGTVHHHAGAGSASSIPDDPIQQLCSLALAGGSDPQSQQPVGATIDAPSTSVTPNAIVLQPLDTQPTVLIFAPAAVLSGVTAPPDAPPPKAA